jgi:hypothetical protein
VSIEYEFSAYFFSTASLASCLSLSINRYIILVKILLMSESDNTTDLSQMANKSIKHYFLSSTSSILILNSSMQLVFPLNFVTANTVIACSVSLNWMFPGSERYSLSSSKSETLHLVRCYSSMVPSKALVGFLLLRIYKRMVTRSVAYVFAVMK